MQLPDTSKKTREYLQQLGLSKDELLYVMIDRFGDELLRQIDVETCYKAAGKQGGHALRNWAITKTWKPSRLAARAVKGARNRAGLTQKELAELMGKKIWFIRDLEQGKDCYPKGMRDIAAALNDKHLNKLLIVIGWLDDPESSAPLAPNPIPDSPSDSDRLAIHLETDPWDEWMPQEAFDLIEAEFTGADRQLTTV
jgi:transcriptional regulator with XRE-family HTH domain